MHVIRVSPFFCSFIKENAFNLSYRKTLLSSFVSFRISSISDNVVYSSYFDSFLTQKIHVTSLLWENIFKTSLKDEVKKQLINYLHIVEKIHKKSVHTQLK